MIHFSNHAIDRYRERVKPAMKRNHVRRELIHLGRLTELTDLPPKWWTTMKQETPQDDRRYLEVSDGVCFALRPIGKDWLATTCVTRAGMKRGRKKPRKVNDFYTSRPKRVRRNQLRRAA